MARPREEASSGWGHFEIIKRAFWKNQNLTRVPLLTEQHFPYFFLWPIIFYRDGVGLTYSASNSLTIKIIYMKIANDRIWTLALWCCKQLLCQLWRGHRPFSEVFCVSKKMIKKLNVIVGLFGRSLEQIFFKNYLVHF